MAKQKAAAPVERKRQAMEGTRLNAFGVDPSDLVIVGLDTEKDPTHPLHDKRVDKPLDEGLVKNIKKFGVLETILVRKNGTTIEVVDGRQRVRATREANRQLIEEGMEPHKVPCFVKRSEDIMGVMLSTFIRSGDSPMEEAIKIQRYLDTGKSEADAALVYGVNIATIKSRLAMLDLAPKVREAVVEGKIAAFAVLELGDLPRKGQESKLAEILATGGTAVRMGQLKKDRKAREKDAAPANHSKVVSRDTLRKLLKADVFTTNTKPETREFLAWVLGEGDGGRLAEMLADFT